MKDFNEYIIEKFKINKNVDLGDFSDIKGIIETCIAKRFKTHNVSYKIDYEIYKSDNPIIDSYILFTIIFDKKVHINRMYKLGDDIKESWDKSLPLSIFSIIYIDENNKLEIKCHEKSK